MGNDVRCKRIGLIEFNGRSEQNRHAFTLSEVDGTPNYRGIRCKYYCQFVGC